MMVRCFIVGEREKIGKWRLAMATWRERKEKEKRGGEGEKKRRKEEKRGKMGQTAPNIVELGLPVCGMGHTWLWYMCVVENCVSYVVSEVLSIIHPDPENL